MANTFTNGTLPDPLEVSVGRALRGVVGAAPYMGAIYSASNEAIAECAAGVLVAQSWGGGAMEYTGAQTDACVWRVPRIGDDFADVQCEAYVSAAGASNVDFSSTVDSVSVAFGAGGPSWQTPGVLDIGAGGPTAATPYDDITLEVAGDTVDVRSVNIRHIPLTSPLSAGLRNDVAPFGASSMVPDVAMTAAHGRRLIDNIVELRRRPRPLLCWSAVDAAVNADLARASSLPRRSITLLRRGALDLGRSYRVWINATPDGADDTVVVLKAGGLWGAVEGTVLTIPSGGARAWFTTTIRLPESEHVPALVPFYGIRVGFWCAGPAGPAGDASTAEIHSASIWGE